VTIPLILYDLLGKVRGMYWDSIAWLLKTPSRKRSSRNVNHALATDRRPGILPESS
jgi:hypothetical protein